MSADRREEAGAAGTAGPAEAGADTGAGRGAASAEAADLARARREFAAVLGEFRRGTVLVPLDEYESLWTAEWGGVRWICAFSDEEALARFAFAQGDAGREWTYRTVYGARLLDVMVPALGVPAGVALDAGSEDGRLFPPVAGIVPEGAAVDLDGTSRTGTESGTTGPGGHA